MKARLQRTTPHISLFIFWVSEEVEVMDTKLQIRSHSNKPHQPVFTDRLNMFHRLVKSITLNLPGIEASGRRRSPFLLKNWKTNRLVLIIFSTLLKTWTNVMENWNCLSNLTGIGMLLQQNCEKLLSTFFQWFILKYLSSIQQYVLRWNWSLSSRFIQDPTHPSPGRRGSLCSSFICSVLFCFIAESVSFRHFCTFYSLASEFFDCEYKDTTEDWDSAPGAEFQNKLQKCCNRSSEGLVKINNIVYTPPSHP